MKYAYIKVDTNDADYISEFSVISDKDEGLLRKLATLLPAKGYRFGKGECVDRYPPSDLYPEFTEEELEEISDLLPYNEYGSHSIDEITFYEVSNTEKLV